MRLDFVDLRLFLLIAEYKNLTLAADAFPMALSAASFRLKKMEELYGVSLVTRHARGIQLTQAGDALRFHAQQILRSNKSLENDMADLAGKGRRVLKLYANTLATQAFIPDVLGKYLAHEPNVDVHLHEQPSQKIFEYLVAGQADLGILDGRLNTEGQIECLSLHKDKLVVIAPDDHPVSYYRSLLYEDALSYPFVGLSDKSALQRYLDKMADIAGKTVRFRVRTSNFISIIHLVEQKVGLGIVPEHIVEKFGRHLNLITIPLANSWAERELVIGARSFKKLPVHGREFVQLLTLTNQTKAQT